MKFPVPAACVVVVSGIFLIMSGCAAGNKGGASVVPSELATPSPRNEAVAGTFTAQVSVEGNLPGGVRIGGVDFTLNLPQGVSVRTGTDGQVLPEVVTLSGGATGSLSVVRFTPATGGIPAQLRLAAVKGEGFDTGQVANVSFSVTGAPPKADDFGTSALLVIDQKAKPLAGFRIVVRPTAK